MIYHKIIFSILNQNSQLQEYLNVYLKKNILFEILKKNKDELNILREIQHFISVQMGRDDFNIIDAFQEMDVSFSNNITSNDLCSFLDRCGIKCPFSVTNAIIFRIDKESLGKISLNSFTIMFDTYTGRYVPNGKQMENLQLFQEKKTRSFDNCMSFLESIAKKPQINYTRLHYVNSVGVEHKTVMEGDMYYIIKIFMLNLNLEN